MEGQAVSTACEQMLRIGTAFHKAGVASRLQSTIGAPKRPHASNPTTQPEFDSAGLGWGPRSGISNQLPGDIIAACLGTTL